MKIAFINGSPKLKESASGFLLEEIKTFVGKDNILIQCDLHKPQISSEQMEQLYSCDAFIVAFPLYVDAIPSHLLYCLKELQVYINAKTIRPIRVYTLVNCGFYEGKQNTNAIDIVRNWTHKAGLIWGQGIGIGAGGMIGALNKVPIGHGPKKNLGKAFNEFIPNIENGRSGDTIFFSMNFPRFAYQYCAHLGWKQQAKANGLTGKDLYKQL